MCGIAGIIQNGVVHADGTERVGRMVESLRHRGPDDRGVDAFGHAVLGHARLSIVDLVSGDQPMRDRNGARGIVFNGEIYGYKDLRKHLDYPFRTASDTEVILALYERYGTDMLKHLPGMFAFAIWDDQKQLLFAARDRFGEKPLYYAQPESGGLVFASEIKAILAAGLVKPKLDRCALAHYLNRLYVPVGHSIYQTIQQLPPAHALEYRNGSIRTWRYWNLPETRDAVSLGDAAEEFRRLLGNAVRKQLVADVEVGAFLSGGLDSSTIVALAANAAPALRTFSFGFTDGPSEIDFARDVARMHDTEHIEMYDSRESLPALAEKMADIYDEPFGDSSAIPTYMICRQARKHLKVVLTGDGGDELLGGYPWYRHVAFHGMLESRTRLANALHYFVLRARRRFLGGGGELNRKLETFNRFRAGTNSAATHRRLRDFVSREDLALAGLSLDLGGDQPGSDAADSAMRTDINDYMTGDILVKTDRASMAHGLELRAPFLDVDVAGFCLSLPSRLKVNNTCDKILLREACRHDWPPSLQNRGKQGFGAPVRNWLQRPAFRELKQAYLGESAHPVQSLLGKDFVNRIASRDDDGTWALLMLAIWFSRNHVEF